MAKYRYRIESGNYGGELTIGEVPAEFVEYWKHEEQEDLIDEVVSFDDMEDEVEPDDALEDPDQVPALESYWHDIDDLEHMNGSYSDGHWQVTSVPADGSDDWAYDEEAIEVEPSHIYGRECYSSEEIDDEYADQTVPVLMFHSSEKGSFASWFLDTDEEFDPKKLAFGSCETDLADLVETVYYGKEELEANWDYNDTTGKAYYAKVGYVNRKWHDPLDYYTIEQLEEDGYFDV